MILVKEIWDRTWHSSDKFLRDDNLPWFQGPDKTAVGMMWNDVILIFVLKLYFRLSYNPNFDFGCIYGFILCCQLQSTD